MISAVGSLTLDIQQDEFGSILVTDKKTERLYLEYDEKHDTRYIYFADVNDDPTAHRNQVLSYNPSTKKLLIESKRKDALYQL